MWVGGLGGGGGGALSLLLNPSMILALSSRLTYSYRPKIRYTKGQVWSKKCLC